MAGAPSVVTKNIFFILIPLSSKCLVKVSSISFPVVVPYIGFKQHSFSGTSPSQQCLTLKTFAVFNAIVCCLFTSLAMSMLRLSIVRAETGIFWILEIMVLLLSNLRRWHNWEMPPLLILRQWWFSMLSNALCSFVVTFGRSICTRNHFLENAAMLCVARYRLFQQLDLLWIVRRRFLVLRFKMLFYAWCPANNVLTAEHTHSSVVSRNETEICRPGFLERSED